MAARVAARPHKAVREDAALQVRAELVLDIAGQAALVLLAGVREKGLEVVANERVEGRLRRSTRGIRGSEAGHEGPLWLRACHAGRRVFSGTCNGPTLSRTGWARPTDSAGSPSSRVRVPDPLRPLPARVDRDIPPFARVVAPLARLAPRARAANAASERRAELARPRDPDSRRPLRTRVARDTSPPWPAHEVVLWQDRPPLAPSRTTSGTLL